MRKLIIASTLTTLSLFSINHASAGFDKKQWAVHLLNFTGEIPNKPAKGFKTLTYPIKVVTGTDDRKTYYSQYINFNVPTQKRYAYYVGIQPQENNEAQVIFSVFGDAKKIDAECSGSADGGAGSSCSKRVTYKKGVTYNFIADFDKEENNYNYWSGYVVDTSTNTKTRIGRWATPIAWEYLSGKSIGFIEIYTGINSCNEVIPTSAFFEGGIGELGNNVQSRGIINAAYDVGVCKGKFNFNSTNPAEKTNGRTFTIEQGVD
nr:DUF3472 domain-containing protein [Acinetobacter sp. Marseille-Q1620]